MLLKWSSLYALRDLPIRKILIPASLIVPLLAATFDVTNRVLPTDGIENGFNIQVIISQMKFQYNPLLFWYYIAFLFYFGFLVVVDLFVPEAVRKYRDFDNFLLQTTNAVNTIGASLPMVDSDPTRIISVSTDYWSRMNTKNPLGRLVASLLLFFPVLIIGFGVFVYVPGKILQFDSAARLFYAFFLFWR